MRDEGLDVGSASVSDAEEARGTRDFFWVSSGLLACNIQQVHIYCGEFVFSRCARSVHLCSPLCCFSPWHTESTLQSSMEKKKHMQPLVHGVRTHASEHHEVRNIWRIPAAHAAGPGRKQLHKHSDGPGCDFLLVRCRHAPPQGWLFTLCVILWAKNLLSFEVVEK